MNEAWDRLIRRRLAGLGEQHLHRQRRLVRPIDATHIEVDGRLYINFASNNYLGLTHHPHVIEAAAAAVRRDGAGGGASPLVTGYTAAHESAERRIAAWKQTEAAVLLPSGYQANLAAVQMIATIHAGALADSGGGGIGVRFLLDKLVHASLVDAVRQSGIPFRVFPHNGLDKLSRLLHEADPGQTQVVVTESIFSMDGDAAPLRELARLKRDAGFVLLLDEAHGSGVYGPAGAGLAAHLGLAHLADLTVVTFSKALGCAGAAVCGSRAVCDAVVNFGRAYIYSTTVAPAVAAAIHAAIDILHDEPQRTLRLRELALHVRHALGHAGAQIPPGDSPIIPLILGSEQATVAAAARFADQGLWVTPIRPPTVPRGASRLRIALSSLHTDDEVAQLIDAVRSLHRPTGTDLNSADGGI